MFKSPTCTQRDIRTAERMARIANVSLEELGKEYGVSPTVMATAWILRHPAKMQMIAGTMNPEHLKEICSAADVALSRKHWYELYLAAGNVMP